MHALQHANYALEDFESSPTCDTSNPSTGWFLVPSLHGFKRPGILFSLEWCCASAGRPTHIRGDLWWRSLMSSVIEFFSPVSLWRNWLSSHTRFRSHLLVMTLAWASKSCLLCSEQNASMPYYIEEGVKSVSCHVVLPWEQNEWGTVC